MNNCSGKMTQYRLKFQLNTAFCYPFFVYPPCCGRTDQGWDFFTYNKGEWHFLCLTYIPQTWRHPLIGLICMVEGCCVRRLVASAYFPDLAWGPTKCTDQLTSTGHLVMRTLLFCTKYTCHLSPRSRSLCLSVFPLVYDVVLAMQA